MLDEEKKAINQLKADTNFYDYELKNGKYIYELFKIEVYKKDVDVILNLIEKQSKQIEKLQVINQMQKYRIEVMDERELISRDEVEEIMLAQWESIEMKNSLLSAYMHLCTEQFQLPFISDIKGKKTVEQHQRTRKIVTAKKSYSFEQNLISNIWFYQQYLTRIGH